MYETFYQLSADPFRLSPDLGFCFQHRTYRKAMTYMLHALYRAEGFIMITGRPGTGKTTLINDLIQTLKPDQSIVANIVSTQLTADDLLNLVAYSFNLDPEGCSKAKVLVQVERFLKQQYQQGRRPLLIVDEAQDMDEDALEELRLLTNILAGNQQLLQVFLVGQEQLRDKLNRLSLEQLHQRLIAATFLEPLDVDDTRAYIRHRLGRVNWTGDPLISTEAYGIIQRYSHGIPRRINQICSRLFLHGSIEEKHRLGIADVKIVVEELQQELLLPMDKEGVNEVLPWPAEQYEETYEEDPQSSSPAPKILLQVAENLSATETAEHKPPSIVADTRPHMPAREPVSVAGPDPGACNNQASTHHKKRGWQAELLALLSALDRYTSRAARLLRDRIRKISRPAVWSGAATVLVLITAILAAYFSNGDRDRSVSDQELLALKQAGTKQAVQSATEDTALTSVQPQPVNPPTEEQASSGTRDSADEVSSKTSGGEEIFAALDIESRNPPGLELGPIETSPPAPRLAIVDPDKAALPDNANDETVEAKNPSLDEQASARKAAPVIALSQGGQAEQAAALAPVKKLSVAPPLSKEEEIAALLAHGRRSLRRDRLVVPKNNNAYHYFQRVLKLDPGNSDALYGIEQIVARYATLAANALDNSDKKKAERYIARGFRISPNDEGLLALRDRMNAPPVEVVAEQPPPVIPAPEPKAEKFFTRFKAFFTRKPSEKFDNQTQTDEP